jgi:L-rhamnose mutarotase
MRLTRPLSLHDYCRISQSFEVSLFPWTELITGLRKAGISDYSIYYDPETQTLFAFQKLTDNNTAGSLPRNPVVRKWWDYMNDGIMEYDE